MEFNKFSKISLPDLFVKRLLRDSKSYNDAKKELGIFSKRHDFNAEETIYFFTKKIIKDGLFFELNEDIKSELLFNSIYWASLQETKKKTRPKNGASIPKEKDKNFYTKLQKDLVMAIYKEYSQHEALLEIKLTESLIFFYELSCIKRNRLSENDLEEDDDL